MFRKKHQGPPDRPFQHTDDCKILKADPDVEIPWSRLEYGQWRRECLCTTEYYNEPFVDDRVRLDPLDPKTSCHLPQCEYISEIDPAVLRVLLKVTPGLGGGYSWVTCGACDAGWQVADYAESVR